MLGTIFQARPSDRAAYGTAFAGGGIVTTLRLLAIGFIFVCTAVAWSILGSTVVGRTGQTDGRLSQEVAQLWGGHHVQRRPRRPSVAPGRSRMRSRTRTPRAARWSAP